MGKIYSRHARILAVIWFSFFVTSTAQQAPSTRKIEDGKTDVKVTNRDGESRVSVLTKGVGNFISSFKSDNRSNVNLHESHYFSSTVDVLIENPRLPENMLGRAKPARTKLNQLPSGLERWQQTLAAWKKRNGRKILYEKLPLNISVDALNPCELGQMAERGIPLVSNEKGYYIQEMLEQGLPVMLDHVELEDPATGRTWSPSSLKRKDGEPLRLILRPKNGQIEILIGYGTKEVGFVNYSKGWSTVPARVTSITRSIRQDPKDTESVYGEDYFREQKDIPIFVADAQISTTDLEAVSLFSSTQEKAFRNGEGKDQRAQLSVTALIVSHSLRALRLVVPVAHYHHFALLPLSKLRPLGGWFTGLSKDYLAIGDEVPFDQLKDLKPSPLGGPQKVLTRYENKLVCLKSAQFNPALSDRAWGE